MSEASRRIWLSPPHMGGDEEALVAEAFRENWVAPVGPHIPRFEAEFAEAVGADHAVALSSGTAALHLALREVGVGPGDRVVVSTFTFIASVTPIVYQGAEPVFVDSETRSWNMDPALLEEALDAGPPPRAVILVHLYGQSADVDPVRRLCGARGIALVEDAAEALGASYRGRSPGTFGRVGAFSLNGNKIITTSGGGVLVTDDGRLAEHARKLATQARDPAPHYQHSEIGYNYRLSNVLAGIGRGQLRVLDARVAARRRVFELYLERLGDLPGFAFMPEPEWGRSSRWLTCATVDAERFGAHRDEVVAALAGDDIEARPVWKPMHLQPVFDGCGVYGGQVSEALFRNGLCLPSGSALTEADVDRISDIVRSVAG